MMEELLPCPFCGGEAETKEWLVGNEPNVHPQIKIWCDTFGCHVYPSIFGNKETMTKIWNTRAYAELQKGV